MFNLHTGPGNTTSEAALRPLQNTEPSRLRLFSEADDSKDQVANERDYGEAIAHQANTELSQMVYQSGEAFNFKNLNFQIKVTKEGQLEVVTDPKAFENSQGGFTLMVIPEKNGIVEDRSILDLDLVSSQKPARYDLSNFSTQKLHFVILPSNDRKLGVSLSRRENDFKKAA